LRRTEDLSSNLKTLDEKVCNHEKLLKKRTKNLQLTNDLKEAQFEIKNCDLSKYKNIPILVNLKKKRQKLFNLYHLIYFSLSDLELPETTELSQKNKDISEHQKILDRVGRHMQAIEDYETLLSVVLPTDISLPEDLSPKHEKRKKLLLGLTKASQEILTMEEELLSINKKVTEGICPLCLREGESHV
jgi:hypothetical protein